MKEMRGAFAVGPTFGTDYLPLDPVQAMREGTAHRVPLIVGTNADEGGSSPGSSSCCRRPSR